MNTILIKQVRVGSDVCDILIKGNLIDRIAPAIDYHADIVIDGTWRAVIPGFVNAHAHSAMTLFRGIGEDVPLEQWLNERVWPYEARLDDEMVYWGAKLACLEMIHTGTTTFNDMYWHVSGTIRAAEEMGMRSVQSYCWIDNFDEEKALKKRMKMEKMYEDSLQWGPLTHFALAPHAIYTVSEKGWKWIARFAKENNLIIHTHLAETRAELEQSERDFGMSPTEYLNRLGVLGPNLIAAHSLWLSSEDIKILGSHHVNTVHNPNSNFKLASGYKFKYNELRDAGANVCIGTDGCASSNSLDMVDSMKAAALMQKVWRNDPSAVPLNELIEMATCNGAKALRIKTGKIATGYLADLALIDLNHPAFVPDHDFYANLIYAANGDCVDTVICDGKIIMKNKHIPDEEYILKQAQKMAGRLVEKESGTQQL